MNAHLTTLLATALLGTAALAHAEPAIYNNGVLTIPAGAQISAESEAYYTNIRLNTDADGRLTITEATPMPLAHVEEVDFVLGDEPVDGDTVPTAKLEVSGFFGTPCHGPFLEPAMTRQGNELVVLLAFVPAAAGTICADVIEPFSLDIPLDLRGVEPGVYTVRVNDVETSVEL
jgi:hypothetical protein